MKPTFDVGSGGGSGGGVLGGSSLLALTHLELGSLDRMRGEHLWGSESVVVSTCMLGGGSLDRMRGEHLLEDDREEQVDHEEAAEHDNEHEEDARGRREGRHQRVHGLSPRVKSDRLQDHDASDADVVEAHQPGKGRLRKVTTLGARSALRMVLQLRVACLARIKGLLRINRRLVRIAAALHRLAPPLARLAATFVWLDDPEPPKHGQEQRMQLSDSQQGARGGRGCGCDRLVGQPLQRPRPRGMQHSKQRPGRESSFVKRRDERRVERRSKRHDLSERALRAGMAGQLLEAGQGTSVV